MLACCLANPSTRPLLLDGADGVSVGEAGSGSARAAGEVSARVCGGQSGDRGGKGLIRRKRALRLVGWHGGKQGGRWPRWAWLGISCEPTTKALSPPATDRAIMSPKMHLSGS